MKKLFILLPLMFLLTSCVGLFGNRLDTPTNIRYNNEYLVWDAVDGATFYLVLMGGETYVALENRLSTFNIESGNYRVRIQASTGSITSRFSGTYRLNLEREFDHPKNFRYKDDTLIWTDVDPESGYIIDFLHVIDGDQFIITDACTQGTCYFDLTTADVEENRVYEVRIASAYEKEAGALDLGLDFRTSLFTSPITIHTYFDVMSTVMITAPLIIDSDMEIDFPSNYTIRHVFYNNEYVDRSKFSFSGSTLIVKESFVERLNYGENTIILITAVGRIDLVITKIPS
jgi:hypothetical protein